MSVSVQNNNMAVLNELFTAFMERCVDEGGPLAEYDESIEASLKEFWNEEKNQDIFNTAIKKLKGTTTRSKKSKSSSDSDGEKKRRPKSAYIFFCKETRSAVVETMTEENDGTKPKPAEVLSALGAAWKELKASSKPKDKKLLAKFEQMAADDKEECHKENGTTEKEKKKSDGKPKRAKSAYLYFCQEKRAAVKQELEDENGEKPKPTEVTQELSRQWNALKGSKAAADKKELKRFEGMSKEDKVRYESEKESYESDKDSGTSSDKEISLESLGLDDDDDDDKKAKSKTDSDDDEKPKTKPKPKPKSDSDDDKPKVASKRPKVRTTGYAIFCKELRADIKEQLEADGEPCGPGDVTKKLSVEWKELSEEDKEEYKERAVEMNKA